ncbi:ABC transporter ATP-binding protein [Aureimonas sp. AU20]|uniref:ABC transporter ATP-binding protein n=1 Tax=Aureimonas sp. AU20 TaxID=1349819 RepID=UPI0007208769|nr:sn-glycerol-3-phosphate ABC transporter ATP-binding protein UgpC [Aureimonas sp. AU20]ALN75200.1 hypothetical protein M673_20925 [Aureimonas sp. AU20]
MSSPAYQIEIDRLNKHYGTFHALHDIDVKVAPGTFVALVGPSGCGKSTLLRTLAGLETVSSGDIRIAGESVAKRPPRQRDVAMVFQSYALYPHMSVADNMSYALRLRGRAKQEIAAATRKAAETLGLTGLLDRLPRELSGGQRQRVAMGRAIVRDPKVFLFDEPLSNLDAALRVHMRGEIRKLHDRLGATSIYVTHDQIEAMTMADHIVILRAGVVEQQGAPLDLYDRPANIFVAGFIGSPAMNFVPAVVDDTGARARAEDGGLTLALGGKAQPGQRVTLGLRPEHLKIAASGEPDAFEARVETLESTGSASFLKVRAGEQTLVVSLAERRVHIADERIHLRIDIPAIHVFDRESQERIDLRAL